MERGTETSVFSVKEFLANCNGSNYYDVAEEELNVSFQVYQLLCVLVSVVLLALYSTRYSVWDI